MAKDIPLNTECLALMQLPDLFNLIDDMLAKGIHPKPQIPHPTHRTLETNP
jgi:hypothetical protein